MKIGLFVPLVAPRVDRAYLREIGESAEERNFDSIWVSEHVVVPELYASRYPYSPDGRMPGPTSAGLLDPIAAIGFLAGVTERLRLGTGVCLVPSRNPVYLAKEIATLDWLSGGRLEFGIGVGWLREEFDAVAAPFQRRGERCRSYLRVMQRLWCDEISVYSDEFFVLPACRQYPKPVQRPHPPIHVGGESVAALRRVAEFGQGWYAFELEPDALGLRIEQLKVQLQRFGRRLEDVEISVCPGTAGCDRAKLRHYAQLGVNRVIAWVPPRRREHLRRDLDRIAEDLLAVAAR